MMHFLNNPIVGLVIAYLILRYMTDFFGKK